MGRAKENSGAQAGEKENVFKQDLNRNGESGRWRHGKVVPDGRHCREAHPHISSQSSRDKYMGI